MNNSVKIFIVLIMLAVAFAGLSRIQSNKTAKNGSKYVAVSSGSGG